MPVVHRLGERVGNSRTHADQRQDEAEIVSVPPHWIPERPTLQNYQAIFRSGVKTVTYESSSHKDPAAGGYIPSTAANLLPGMANSFEVAFAVVVLNLLVGVPAAYAIAKIRFHGRSAAVYSILATRVIPDIALVVPFFLIIKKLGLVDNLLSLVVTYLAIRHRSPSSFWSAISRHCRTSSTRPRGSTAARACRRCGMCSCRSRRRHWSRSCCSRSWRVGTSSCWR
jgi:ABC-type sugar transport system permease subunit